MAQVGLCRGERYGGRRPGAGLQPGARGMAAGGRRIGPAEPASAIRAARRERGSAAAALNAHKRDADL